MDNQKIGKYIAYKRKQRGMTQQNLADSLLVTNKAVSKWETGTSLPDISLLQDLANILDVSVDEILSGEDSLMTQEKEVHQYHIFHINQDIYKTYYQEQLYQKQLLLGFIFVLASVFLMGGYALFSIERYIQKHMDIFGMMLMLLGVICFFLPFIWKIVKVHSSHVKESQYQFFDDHIKYKQDGKEIEYFYWNIKQVKEFDSFVVWICGKDILFLDKKDYLLIQNRLTSEVIKPINKYQKRKLWVLIILFALVTLLTCLFIGYQIILKRFQFEFIFEQFNIIIPTTILILIVNIILLFKMKITKMIGWSMTIISVLFLIASYYIGDSVSAYNTYYSISPDFSSKLVIKQNKETGKVYDYHYQFLCFARQSEAFDSQVNSQITTKWLNGDNNLVTYDNGQQVYVATYGDRGNGISYYQVAGSLVGKWIPQNDEDKAYEVNVENGAITISLDNDSMTFSYQEIEQYGTTAIVLKKGSNPQYVIALNKNCELDKNYQIKDGGTITIVDAHHPSPVELFCSTPKQNDDRLVDIEEEKREEAQSFINTMQDIAHNDQKYKDFESRSDIFKIDTTSTDYFEVARRAYFEEYAKPNDSGIKVDEQITTITVEAGTIDDFYVNIKSVGTYSSNIESETGGMDVHYRIMKASTGYLVGSCSPTINYNVGLVPLNPMISKDVSENPIYHYTK